MSGDIYGSELEDIHHARQLNEYLSQEPEDEYLYPPEVEIEQDGQDCSFPYGYAYIAKKGKWIYTSGYFVDTRFYAEEEKEFYDEKYWRKEL